MGIFDKFKKENKNEIFFDENSQTYRVERDNIIFSFDEKPNDDYKSKINKYVIAYKNQLSSIIDFMMPDIIEMYGEVQKNEVLQKLGKPIIDYMNGTVTYCEQSFDDIHIFTFEFLDEEFKNLQYFSIDG